MGFSYYECLTVGCDGAFASGGRTEEHPLCLYCGSMDLKEITQDEWFESMNRKIAMANERSAMTKPTLKQERLAVSSDLHARLKRRAKVLNISIQALTKLCIEHGLTHLESVAVNNEVVAAWKEGE